MPCLSLPEKPGYPWLERPRSSSFSEKAEVWTQMPQNMELIEIVRNTPWFMRALRAIRHLGLSSWCIGAGALRNATWDALHEKSEPSPLADIDVAHFDVADLSRQRDQEIEEELRRQEPDLPWEVTNQAGVHLWFEGKFGHPVAALASLEEAVASWPETATAVAVWLDREDRLHVIAPLGLDDLLGMVVRRNPRRVSLETYHHRLETKRYRDRWPKVRIEPE